MPAILLLAVPLQKSWLGIHYWKTPTLMDLPVELEYIPYHEFEDRFARLNTIARPVYPTIWPNIVMFLVFVGLFSTALVGLSVAGAGLSIMSQGACFILPIIAVVWIRVRKETKAKARKKFKQRSQKLLRTWTAQDFVTHAMQWKLRLRPKSAAKRWRTLGQHGSHPIPPILQQTIPIPPAQPSAPSAPSRVSTSGIRSLPSEEEIVSSGLHSDRTVVVLEDDSQDTRQTNALSSPSSPTTESAPRRVEDVYAALSSPTRPATTAILPQFQTPTRTPTPVTSTATNAATTGAVAGTTAATGTGNSLIRSRWDAWVDLFRDLYCCGFIFREPKVWMIEISIREGILDEYALPVPSPAYCDYRLPGYEDVISGRLAGSTNAVNTSLSMSSPAALSLQRRYSGPPPEYESDSENDSDSENEDGDGEDDEDESDRNSTRSVSRQRGVTQGRSNGEHSVPIEMTAVMTTSPSPITARYSGAIRAEASTATRIAHSGEDTEQDMSTSLDSSNSLSTLPESETTVLSIALEDKEEGPVTTSKEE